VTSALKRLDTKQPHLPGTAQPRPSLRPVRGHGRGAIGGEPPSGRLQSEQPEFLTDGRYKPHAAKGCDLDRGELSLEDPAEGSLAGRRRPPPRGGP
jgi:hypothetical protein